MMPKYKAWPFSQGHLWIFPDSYRISRRICTLIGCGMLAPFAASAQLSFDGTSLPPIMVTPDKSTGLSAIVVIDAATPSFSITYQSSGASRPVWSVFGMNGAAYAEPLPDGSVEYNGNKSALRGAGVECGYMIEDGNTTTYFWVIDYTRHHLVLNSLEYSNESDCSTATLDFSGNASAIYYYSINGRRLELSREMSLTYDNLEYSSEANEYVPVQSVITLPHVDNAIHCPFSFADTYYILEGDRFLRQWNSDEISVSTSLINSRRVEAQTFAEQSDESYDNQQRVPSGDDGALGGSAPVEITFSAVTTPAAIFTEWQFSDYPEFEIISLRDNNLDFSRTFRDAGTTYVRFMAADAEGVCEYFSPTYQINIGESALHCPNAFSPQGSPGINDEWKVSYRSITEFKCSIFNRWGVCVATLDHPSQGWNGKYKGKYVGAGVYYYVIKARGADGRNYNLKGDINIIDYNNENNTTSPVPAP